jgi:C4-dicarboxylate-specific signal transduction histidine kinase
MELPDAVMSILDEIPLGIFIKNCNDDQHRYVAWNKSMSGIFAVPASQIVGTDGSAFFGKVESQRQKKLEHFAENQAKPLDVPEETFTSPEPILTRTIRIPIRMGASRLILGIVENLTEARGLEDSARAHEARVQASARVNALGEMASGIAHEINNPLTVINGSLQLVRRHLINNSSLVPQVERSLERAEQMVFRISRIIKVLSQLGQSNEPEQTADAEVKGIINNALMLFSQRCDHAGTSLDVNLEDPDLVVQCKATDLTMMLVELLLNAFEANRGVKNPSINLSTATNGNILEFRVVDGGPEIPTQVVSKMFQPFFTTRKVGEGMGLGLCIAQNIAREHGGDLRYTRENGKTKFVARVPLRQDEGGRAP